MAPTRLVSKPITMNENMNGILTHGITTRSKQMATQKGISGVKMPNKRKADSPLKDLKMAKRAAFGDITNALNKAAALQDKEKVQPLKKVTVETKVLPILKKSQNSTAILKTSKAKQLQQVATNAIESVQKRFIKDVSKPISTKAQNGILKNIERKDRLSGNKENQSQNSSAKSAKSDTSGEPSLYMTALENISPADVKESFQAISEKLDQVALDDAAERSMLAETEPPHRPPRGVADFDLENWNDPYQVSNYAMDIFNYMKSREPQFAITDYLLKLTGITSWMRALLVDWMVEVQESFELNHETLYLAVKLVDLYLSRCTQPPRRARERPPPAITKEELQLLGAASLFIAAKFDERIPPLVDDFLYICDGAYSLSQLLHMEMRVLHVVDFDLGVPLSYRFLRRYARCARVSMPTLTLARFVLELCLLDYALVPLSDSKMAAAALYIALRMKSLGGWTPTLEYYTGYKLDELMPIVLSQNAVLHKKPKSAISTVRNKYTHTIFFEVAKVPLLADASLSAAPAAAAAAATAAATAPAS